VKTKLTKAELRRATTTQTRTPPSLAYGAEHLLRLLSCLPALTSGTMFQADQVRREPSFFVCFDVVCGKERTFFVCFSALCFSLSVCRARFNIASAGADCRGTMF
jgi:hypothetical protein